MAETVYVTIGALDWRGPRKYELKREFKTGTIDVLPYGRFYSGECFKTWSEALANCEARRATEIATLKNTIAKLENLTFVEPTEITR